MKKIGVYDSGLGGVSLIGHLGLIKDAPFQEIYYFSDYSRLPYGDHDTLKLQKIGQEIVEHLIKQDVDIILVACNTATVNTIDFLRSKFEIPFVGIEPYVNAVNREIVLSESKNIGLIMTPATAKSARYNYLEKQFDTEKKIRPIAHGRLATLIENYVRLKSSFINSQNDHHQIDELRNEINQEIGALKDKNLDALILGCTHYPIFQQEFENILNVPIIDPAKFVIDQLLKIAGDESFGQYPNVYYSESCDVDWKSVDFNELLSLVKT